MNGNTNEHCLICENYSGCRGECPGYEGGMARPACWQRAGDRPGDCDPVTGNLLAVQEVHTT